MPSPAVLIAAWARSAVLPHGGGFGGLAAHEIAAPVVREVLRRAGVPPGAVDAVVAGNALGAGGNPARMLALAAGLPDACPALTVDTQCCAGLDAVALGAALVASGEAQVVLAGGVEAWSRAPVRAHRPLQAGEAAVPYERPAFAPDPARDPDMLESAQRHAAARGWTRAQQDAHACLGHERAVAAEADLAGEIVPVQGQARDAYPRRIDARRAARMPAVLKGAAREAGDAGAAGGPGDCAMSTLHVSAKADGAAFVLLASAQACERLGLLPRARWVAGASVGVAPETPLLGAARAAQEALRRSGEADAQAMAVVELHDAFAAQGLDFAQALGLEPGALNRRGGGLARGHPIGASGAIALVRLLSDLERDAVRGARGLAAVAGAGGLGAAAVVERL
ncbi:acetyl-CoA C-acyltransferase [Ramlibacter sp. MAHUQ-53]|uniref:acetyl-CoA C-acyltransferase n=1 Tax=unclassified Ramlibacter TaxID=2617605 RepID=UPI00364035AC